MPQDEQGMHDAASTGTSTSSSSSSDVEIGARHHCPYPVLARTARPQKCRAACSPRHVRFASQGCSYASVGTGHLFRHFKIHTGSSLTPGDESPRIPCEIGSTLSSTTCNLRKARNNCGARCRPSGSAPCICDWPGCTVSPRTFSPVCRDTSSQS